MLSKECKLQNALQAFILILQAEHGEPDLNAWRFVLHHNQLNAKMCGGGLIDR